MPSVRKARRSKEAIKSSPVLIVSTLSNGPNGWCQCQSIHKALPQSVSKKYTLDEKFFSIATIANVIDLYGEHHTGVWASHL
jgi:hypothetical protein